MTEHRYPAHTMRAAYIRAAAGLFLTAGPLVLARPGTVISLILAALAVLFLVYGVRNWIRHLTMIRLDDGRISAVGPFPLDIGWQNLAAVTLNYYTTKRDGKGGWLQLNLKGTGRTMRIESTIEGFAGIVERAVREAERRGVELSPATRSNLKPLGVTPDGDAGISEAPCPTC